MRSGVGKVCLRSCNFKSHEPHQARDLPLPQTMQQQQQRTTMMRN